LYWTWAIIFVVCAAGCAVARLVGRRLEEVERERSRRQWRHMCEALGAQDLSSPESQEAARRVPQSVVRQ
jgi:hypothetical protein